MSKITFRADDDLIEQLEEFDASKSEVMREALRKFLGETSGPPGDAAAETSEEDSLDELIAERVDAIITDRLDRAFTQPRPQDINVNISLDGDSSVSSDEYADASHATEDSSHEPSNDVPHEELDRKTEQDTDENVSNTCAKCGENLGPQHVYCPNCGEKSAHRVFCECGDELRSDWSFCPSCGRRTPAADVLDGT